MKYTIVTLLLIGAISTSQGVKLEHHHSHHHKSNGHNIGGVKENTISGGNGHKLSQVDCLNDPTQSVCDQYVPTNQSDIVAAQK
jgi:hypothetical protein